MDTCIRFTLFSLLIHFGASGKIILSILMMKHPLAISIYVDRYGIDESYA